jgi:P4 family phage/plasmid primase-like protien
VRSVGPPVAWDPEIIDHAIPLLPEASENRARSDTDEPPIKLGEEALKVWRGEKPKLKDTGEIDRSASLVKIGRALFDAGANRTVLVTALRERDETLGWCKYTGRRDSEERYHEIVDELEANGRTSHLKARVMQPSSGEAPPSANGRGTSESFGGYNLTDLGNAERFVAQHGENVRYCYPWGKWLVWTGTRWQQDSNGRAHRLAKETVRRIYREAAAAEDEDARKALARHATKSEAEARIRAMLELAKSEIPVSPDELDADPWLLNCPNGTVDLRTGEMRPHKRGDLLTKIAGAEYRTEITASTWEAFLERVLPSDKLRSFVQRSCGYSATADTSEQCMFINHGSGANGKSTFQEAIATALGDYATRTPTEMLLAKRAGGIPNDVARLKGARFVTASETEEGRRLAESLVKDLTGQDTISARFMRAEWFDFKPTHKLWLSTNHKPEIRGTDTAIWRRIRLVPWTTVIPPKEQDHRLLDKLGAELSGILTWVVRGCSKWRQEGLKAPQEVRQATMEYRAEMDVLAAFIDECCIVSPRAEAKATPLYNVYKGWCESSSEKPETQRAFGSRLTERGFVRRKRGGIYHWHGIGILADGPEPGPSAEKSPASKNHTFAGKPDRDTQLAGPSGPKLSINSLEGTHVEVMPRLGPDGPDGPGKALRKYFESPPEWLLKQLAQCREDKERFIKPTCVAVATKVYGTATRWEEVIPTVEQCLEGETL